MAYFAKEGDLYVQKSSGAHRLFSVGERVAHVKANRSRTLVAATTARLVAVWLLPSTTSETAGVSGLTAAEGRLAIPQITTSDDIIDVHWHPLARHDAGLVVLTKHELLIITTLPGSPAADTRSFVLQDSDGIPVIAAGLAFGAEGAPLAPLSLYITSTDGDIYRQTPMGPAEIELTSQQLRALEYVAYYDDYEFVFEVWSDLAHEKVGVCRHKTDNSGILRLETSLKLEPYAEELYAEESLDIVTGKFGLGTDVIVHTSTHHINLWAVGGPAADFCKLIASVKFSKADVRRKIELVVAPFVIIRTSTGTQVIKYTGEDITAEQVPGFPEFIVDDNELVALNDTKPVKKWSLTGISGNDEVDKVEKLLSRLNIRPLLEPGWNQRITTKLAEIIDKPVPFQDTILGGTVGALQDFDALADSYQTRILDLLKLATEVRLERQAQCRELLAQLEQMQRLQQWQKRIGNTTDFVRRVQDSFERHLKLRERLTVVEKRVDHGLAMQSPSDPAVGAEEEKWFNQLRNSEETIKHLETQIDLIQGYLDEAKGRTDNAEIRCQEISPAELAAMRRRLYSQALHLQKLETYV